MPSIQAGRGPLRPRDRSTSPLSHSSHPEAPLHSTGVRDTSTLILQVPDSECFHGRCMCVQSSDQAPKAHTPTPSRLSRSPPGTFSPSPVDCGKGNLWCSVLAVSPWPPCHCQLWGAQEQSAIYVTPRGFSSQTTHKVFRQRRQLWASHQVWVAGAEMFPERKGFLNSEDTVSVRSVSPLLWPMVALLVQRALPHSLSCGLTSLWASRH